MMLNQCEVYDSLAYLEHDAFKNKHWASTAHYCQWLTGKECVENAHHCSG